MLVKGSLKIQRYVSPKHNDLHTFGLARFLSKSPCLVPFFSHRRTVAYSPVRRTASLHGHAYRCKSSSHKSNARKNRSDERLLLAFGCGTGQEPAFSRNAYTLTLAASLLHRGSALLALLLRLPLPLQPLTRCHPRIGSPKQ